MADASHPLLATIDWIASLAAGLPAHVIAFRTRAGEPGGLVLEARAEGLASARVTLSSAP